MSDNGKKYKEKRIKRHQIQAWKFNKDTENANEGKTCETKERNEHQQEAAEKKSSKERIEQDQGITENKISETKKRREEKQEAKEKESSETKERIEQGQEITENKSSEIYAIKTETVDGNERKNCETKERYEEKQEVKEKESSEIPAIHTDTEDANEGENFETKERYKEKQEVKEKESYEVLAISTDTEDANEGENFETKKRIKQEQERTKNKSSETKERIEHEQETTGNKSSETKDRYEEKQEAKEKESSEIPAIHTDKEDANKGENFETKERIKQDQETSGNKSSETKERIEHDQETTGNKSSESIRREFKTMSNAVPTTGVERGLWELTGIKEKSMFHCKTCSGGKEYRKNVYRTLIIDPPPVLCIHLNRYKQTKGNITKNCDKVSYKKYLDISTNCTVAAKMFETKPLQTVYRLYGVLIHTGSVSCGHYYVYINTTRSMTTDIQPLLQRNLQKYMDAKNDIVNMLQSSCSAATSANENQPIAQENSNWYYISDEKVTDASEEEVLNQDNVYMLFYERM